jgi:aromatic ring-opening dioxygenase LigB subunit
LLTILPYSS